MKPKAQRIAIAEACGWKPDDDGDGTGWKGSWIHQRLIGMKPTFSKGKVISYPIEQTVPDYLNDLNAMHEAEKLLKSEQHFTFQVELARVINTTTYPLNFALLHATATQRAEAFLRTLNLYTP